ncbi:hypothetical protein HY346_01170 [Candidatus Microgenomates bacterium]|nr:hypothetical protein [Candidatus Microgenomates bacterium]
MADAKNVSATAKAKLGQLEGVLENWFVKKAPVQIPEAGKEFIVKVAPWADLVLLVFMIPAALAIFAVGTTVGLWAPAFGAVVGPMYYVALIVLILQMVIMGMALPGLFKQARKAWQLLYWATLINVVYGLASWLAAPRAVGSFIWSLISATLALYVIFQVRSKYTN